MSRNLRALLPIVLVFAGLVSAAGQNAATQTDAPPAGAQKMVRLMTEAGYQFKVAPRSNTVWSINFTGKTLQDIKVVLTVEDDLVVIFVTVAQKAHMQLTPVCTDRLLHLNDELDRVKVGLDDDDDLFVRTDSSLRTLDAQELKAEVGQVAASADIVYNRISTCRQ